MLPEGFPLLPLDLVQRGGGGGGLWSRVRCTRACFCLLGSFVDCGYRSCSLAANSCFFFLSRLALPPHLCTLDKVMGWESFRNVFSMFSVVSPASSLHVRRGGEAGETSECRSSYGSSLASRSSAWEAGRLLEPTLGRMAFVCGLVAHAVAPLAVLG